MLVLDNRLPALEIVSLRIKRPKSHPLDIPLQSNSWYSYTGIDTGDTVSKRCIGNCGGFVPLLRNPSTIMMYRYSPKFINRNPHDAEPHASMSKIFPRMSFVAFTVLNFVSDLDIQTHAKLACSNYYQSSR